MWVFPSPSLAARGQRGSAEQSRCRGGRIILGAVSHTINEHGWEPSSKGSALFEYFRIDVQKY